MKPLRRRSGLVVRSGEEEVPEAQEEPEKDESTMNASTRNALRQLEQNRQAHDERHDRGLQSARLRWTVPMPARAYRVWQRAVSALVALTLFAGPLSVTFEQSRDAAGVLAVGNHRMDDEVSKARSARLT